MRRWFWIGFILSFLLLMFASCGTLAAVVGFDRLSLTDLQSSERTWSPPPMAEATISSQTGAPNVDGVPGESSGELAFAPGNPARNATSSRVNVRREPGYLGKPTDDILSQLQPGDRVTLLEWPRSADGLLWWRVAVEGQPGVEGWVAESTASGVKILEPVE